VKINQSLFALGDVISALIAHKADAHVHVPGQTVAWLGCGGRLVAGCTDARTEL